MTPAIFEKLTGPTPENLLISSAEGREILMGMVGGISLGLLILLAAYSFIFRRQ